MGLGNLLKNVVKYNPASAVPYFVGDKLDLLGVNAQKRADDLSGEQGLLREKSKQEQLSALGNLKGPTLTPQMEARIKALEDDGNQKILSQDPYFQGSRAQLVSGGANALAGIENKQKGYGVSGGFSNIGSKSDVYDRLGMQLAQLGQQSTERSANARDTAAMARQDYQDKLDQYQNSIIQARAAISANDSAAAIQALNAAAAAKEAATARMQQMAFSAIGLGVGAMTGNPAAAAGGLQNLSQAQQQQTMNVPLNNFVDYNVAPQSKYAKIPYGGLVG